MPATAGPADDRAISYEQWGVDFFEAAISEERVLGAVDTIAGQRIDFGPVDAGPGGIAKVRAYGGIGQPIATRLPGDRVSYRVLLPVSLTFEVDLQIEKQRFDAELLVPLTLTAVAMSGVRINIQATPPRGDEVQVELKAQGLRASVLQRLVGVEGELRRFVAGYVATELAKPLALEARTIDVSAAMPHAWAWIWPRGHDGTAVAGGATADLNDALEREIREHEDTFLGGLDQGDPSQP